MLFWRLSHDWFMQWVTQFIILGSSAFYYVIEKLIVIRSKASLMAGIFNSLVYLVPKNFTGNKL